MGDIGEPPAKIAKIQKIECNGIVGKQRNGYVNLENLGGSTGESPLIRLPKEVIEHFNSGQKHSSLALMQQDLSLGIFQFGMNDLIHLI